MRNDKFIVCRKSREGFWDQVTSHATEEEAVRECEDFARYTWRNGEEVTVFRVQYTPVMTIKAKVELSKEKL